tara:strand:+ start:820 stop:1401 length:582 start_codon:yes stop_codon:yes gene_type:complete
MTFTYTPEQAAAIAARWNDLANARNQINASDVHHVFSDNADSDMAADGATLIEVHPFHSATGAPETFYVMRHDVTIETVADILASDVAARFDISTVEAQRIASMAKDDAEFFLIWEDEDWWRDDVMVKYVSTISHHSIARAPVVSVGSTLHAAKINATSQFGAGYLDHVIQVMDRDGVVVASRRVGDKRWSTA